MFGHDEGISGEIVFSTNMVGYPESITDPSIPESDCLYDHSSSGELRST